MINKFNENKCICHVHKFKSTSKSGFPAKTYVRIFNNQIDFVRYSLIDEVEFNNFDDFNLIKKYKDRYLVGEYFAFLTDSFLEVMVFFQKVGTFHIHKNLK